MNERIENLESEVEQLKARLGDLEKLIQALGLPTMDRLNTIDAAIRVLANYAPEEAKLKLRTIQE